MLYNDGGFEHTGVLFWFTIKSTLVVYIEVLGCTSNCVINSLICYERDEVNRLKLVFRSHGTVKVLS